MRARIILILIGLVLGGLAVKWLDEQSHRQPPVAEVPAAVPPPSSVPSMAASAPAAANSEGLLPDEQHTISLFEAAQGSVVSINTSQEVVDIFSRQRQEVPQGTGSGVIWDDKGHVVTNNHVIEGASAAQVGLADGRVLAASLVGSDPVHDIAVLSIDVGDGPLKPLPLGRSAGLKVGQSVYAIGNPYGLDWTLTTGVVSALDRQIPEQNGYTAGGLIQTDAAINPGNSGGPLIDSAGRMIGMNAAIFSPSGTSAGIGFAVPIDTIARVVPQLIATGRYTPPVLGIEHDDRLDAYARRRGIDGVVVLSVDPGSPAEAAGIVPARTDGQGGIVIGDVLVGIDGHPVANADDLRQAIDTRQPGDKLALTLRRKGKEVAAEVTLAAP